MDLVAAAMGNLPSKLLELLKEEYKLQTGVQEKIRSLSQELEIMYAALDKVARVPPEQLDEQVRLWARDVREVSYEMEDIVDTSSRTPARYGNSSSRRWESSSD
ncbi:unnamed protein product [Urochloa humidicola]